MFKFFDMHIFYNLYNILYISLNSSGLILRQRIFLTKLIIA